MKLQVQNITYEVDKSLNILFTNNNFTIQGDSDVKKINLEDGKKLFYIGEIFYDNKHKSSNFKSFVCEVFHNEDTIKAIELIKKTLNGRFLMMFCDVENSLLSVFSDNYGRFECFFHEKEGKFEIASDLSLKHP